MIAAAQQSPPADHSFAEGLSRPRILHGMRLRITGIRVGTSCGKGKLCAARVLSLQDTDDVLSPEAIGVARWMQAACDCGGDKMGRPDFERQTPGCGDEFVT